MMRRSSLALLLSCVAACGDVDDPTGPRLRDPGTSTSNDAGDRNGEGDGGGGMSDAGSPKDSGGAAQEPEQSGEATYYNAEGLGACGIQTPSDYLVAAINDEQYSKANCGRCVSVTGPKGTVVVRIIDKCPGCDAGDLDLSETAFSKIANKSAGRVKITWRFVDCPF